MGFFTEYTIDKIQEVPSLQQLEYFQYSYFEETHHLPSNPHLFRSVITLHSLINNKLQLRRGELEKIADKEKKVKEEAEKKENEAKGEGNGDKKEEAAKGKTDSK